MVRWAHGASLWDTIVGVLLTFMWTKCARAACNGVESFVFVNKLEHYGGAVFKTGASTYMDCVQIALPDPAILSFDYMDTEQACYKFNQLSKDLSTGSVISELSHYDRVCTITTAAAAETTVALTTAAADETTVALTTVAPLTATWNTSIAATQKAHDGDVTSCYNTTGEEVIDINVDHGRSDVSVNVTVTVNLGQTINCSHLRFVYLWRKLSNCKSSRPCKALTTASSLCEYSCQCGQECILSFFILSGSPRICEVGLSVKD